jgi:cell division protein FtsB
MSHKGGLLPSLGKQAARVLFAMVVVFYTAALFSIIVQGWRVQVQVSALRQEIEALKEEREELLQRAQGAGGDVYIERIAREELKMSKPGEQVFAPTQIAAMPAPPTLTPVPGAEAQLSLPERWLGWVRQLLGIGE